MTTDLLNFELLWRVRSGSSQAHTHLGIKDESPDFSH